MKWSGAVDHVPLRRNVGAKASHDKMFHLPVSWSHTNMSSTSPSRSQSPGTIWSGYVENEPIRAFSESPSLHSCMIHPTVGGFQRKISPCSPLLSQSPTRARSYPAGYARSSSSVVLRFHHDTAWRHEA